jgi:predicted HTH domain antitoxin
MKIELPDNIINAEREKILFDLAVILYTQAKISLGKAARIAGMSYVDFQFKLAELKISMNYNEEMLKEDFGIDATL